MLGRNAEEQTARGAVFAALWQDPKYQRLHERKARIAAAWSRCHMSPVAEEKSLARRHKAACRRIQAYEDAALRAAGLTP